MPFRIKKNNEPNILNVHIYITIFRRFYPFDNKLYHYKNIHELYFSIEKSFISVQKLI